jgi:hypothetical protein
MLKTGRDFLQGLQDGRVVYVGSERRRYCRITGSSEISKGWWAHKDSNLGPAD